MKSFFLNRIVLMGIAFVIGATSVWGTTRYFEQKKADNPLSTYFIKTEPTGLLDDFFKENIGFQGSFDNWFKTHFGAEPAIAQERFFDLNRFQEIKQREDGDFKIYEIDLNGQTPKEVKVDVKDQYVIISAQVEKKEKTANSSQYYSSSFHRSFPVPPDVDGENFKMEQENQKIVIKFPKKKV
jgi:HSP20 family protein